MRQLAYIGYALMVVGLWFAILTSNNLTWYGAIAGTGFCLFLLAAPFLTATQEVLTDYKNEIWARRRARRRWWT